MDYPCVFTQIGLKGRYRPMSEAKYKSVDGCGANFFRYEKENGEKGWYMVDDKKEYPDL